MKKILLASAIALLALDLQTGCKKSESDSGKKEFTDECLASCSEFGDDQKSCYEDAAEDCDAQKECENSSGDDDDDNNNNNNDNDNDNDNDNNDNDDSSGDQCASICESMWSCESSSGDDDDDNDNDNDNDDNDDNDDASGDSDADSDGDADGDADGDSCTEPPADCATSSGYPCACEAAPYCDDGSTCLVVDSASQKGICAKSCTDAGDTSCGSTNCWGLGGQCTPNQNSEYFCVVVCKTGSSEGKCPPGTTCTVAGTDSICR